MVYTVRVAFVPPLGKGRDMARIYRRNKAGRFSTRGEQWSVGRVRITSKRDIEAVRAAFNAGRQPPPRLVKASSSERAARLRTERPAKTEARPGRVKRVSDLPPVPADVTPGDMMQRWAGQKLDARRVELPKRDLLPKPRVVGRLKTKGQQVIGDVLATHKVLSIVQKLKAGTRVRVVAKGKTADGIDIKKTSRERDFMVSRAKDGTKKRGDDWKANQLLHHMMAALGKEFFDARGRGYDILQAGDAIEWSIQIVE